MQIMLSIYMEILMEDIIFYLLQKLIFMIYKIFIRCIFFMKYFIYYKNHINNIYYLILLKIIYQYPNLFSFFLINNPISLNIKCYLSFIYQLRNPFLRLIFQITFNSQNFVFTITMTIQMIFL